MIERINQVANPGGSESLVGFAGLNANLVSVATDPAFRDTPVQRVELSGDPGSFIIVSQAADKLFTVPPGRVVVISVYAWLPSSMTGLSPGSRPSDRQLIPNGTAVAWENLDPALRDQWQRTWTAYRNDDAAAPPAWNAISVAGASAGASGELFTAGWMVEVLPEGAPVEPGSFFYGETPGASWTRARFNSASILIIPDEQPLPGLSERGERMRGSLAPWEQDDPEVIAVMRAYGDELDLVAEFVETVRQHAWPHRADDTYGLLSEHERLLQLPVAPAGLSVGQRQEAIRARFQGRKDGRKYRWVRRLEELLGPYGGNWYYQENTPGGNQLTIKLRLEPGIGLAEQARRLAEVFTPVVVQVIVGYEAGFILGVSSLGEDAL